jgi:F5/8 type C domain
MRGSGHLFEVSILIFGASEAVSTMRFTMEFARNKNYAYRLALLVALACFSNGATIAQTVRVDTTPSHAIPFDPDLALGSSIDNLPQNTFEAVYSEPLLKEALSAGWGPITYRLYTELTISSWHWNPNGTWSDAAHQSGYFTGSAEPKDVIRRSFGYSLPHRGSTHSDDPATKFSRLTDGDLDTFWKSNPYLTSKFTGEDDALHPQWVIVDLATPQDISAMRIAWANPYGRRYQVQYWDGEDAFTKPTGGVWKLFPAGEVGDGKGGTVMLKLCTVPVKTRYLRILMTESSNTCDTHGSDDPRNCLGYAISELYAGNFTASGDFIDLVTHAPSQNQTATYASSMDPWHTAKDVEEQHIQTGFDLFFTSGITNHLPAMVPTGLLYVTPEDSAAEIAYLEKRGYPLSYVEIGEEPDGKKTMPEDYGALYLQWATALHRVDPALKLGGPVFEGFNDDLVMWPDARGRTSWMGRFVDYLKEHGRLSDLAFVSYEHYPFPPCEVTWSDLYREPELVAHMLHVWREDGVPHNVPLMITESNLSWALTEEMSDLFAALWLADNAGSFLASGGAAFYHSPIQPEPLRGGCHGWSTYGNFVANEKLEVRQHTSQYFASQLINQEWVKHSAGVHQLTPAAVDVTDQGQHALVTAYPVKRPDGEWALMLINKDPTNAHEVKIEFADAGSKATHHFSGPVSMVTFGAEQYVWHSEGPRSHADPDGPPATSTVNAGPAATFRLPKASVSVLRGKLGSS